MNKEEEVKQLINQAYEKAYEKFQEKKYEIVCVIAEQILKVSPNEWQAMQILGLSYSALNRFDDSITILKRCLELNSDNAETLNDLALAYSGKYDYDNSIKYLEKAIDVKPDMAVFHSNLGLQYRHKKNNDKAIESFKKSISLSEKPETLAMLGGCYGEKKQLDEAEKYILKALELNPNFAAAHVDLSSILKLQGKWKEGFSEYEWRSDVYDQLQIWKKIYNPAKKWRGEDISGKRIVIHTEQGHGDAIQFIRYLKPLKNKGAYIILHCAESLKSIFFNLADEFYTTEPNTVANWDVGNNTPEHDYHCSVMSLPNILQSIFTYYSYIKVDRNFDLSNYKNNKKIGIVWAGNPQHPNDRERSCRLELFRKISKIDGVKLFSLMKDTRPRAYKDNGISVDLTIGSEDIKVVDLCEYINDFEDTASIINSLDLIISVDSSVIHLAGAMGKPCFGLISWNPDWRWEIEGDCTVWYPSVSLVRQKERGNWDSVFEEVEILVEKFFNE